MNVSGFGLFLLAWLLVIIFLAFYPFFGKKILKIR
jgi:hypothetical protein